MKPAQSSRPSIALVHPNLSLRNNLDFGHSLHQLLHTSSITPANNPDPPTPDTQSWKHNHIRVYFQNINGFCSSNLEAAISQAFIHMQHIQADLFCFNEVNLNHQHQHIISTVHKCKQKIWSAPHEQCKIIFSNCDLPWSTNYQPGGIMMGITNNLVGRTRKAYADPYGRWLRCELLGRDGKIITIICAYQVSQLSGHFGQHTTYSQRIRLMHLNQLPTMNPKQHFIQDLKVLIGQLREANHDIILCGDFNEAIGENPNMMASVTDAGQLTDTFTYLHELNSEVPTYTRGHKRLDYIFASPRIINHLLHAGGEPFNFRIQSDHRGIFADFSFPGFFDRAPHQLMNPASRGFIPDNPKHVRQYLAKTYEYYQDHHINERLDQLAEFPDHDLAEAIDADITRAMLSAETSIKTFQRHPWSRELHEAMTRLHILNAHRSQFKTHIDMTTVIARLQSTLDTVVDLPTSYAEANNHARIALKEVRQVINQGAAHSTQLQEEKALAAHTAQPSQPIEHFRKQITQIQQIKTLYRMIPSTKPKVSGGIKTIQVPVDPQADPTSEETIFKTISDPQQVEQLIIKRNQQHFGQAHTTPLAQPHVLRSLGFGGTSTMARDILQGKGDPSNLTDNLFSQALLKLCHQQTPTLEPTLSIAQIQQSYRRWKVSTSTSPSGRHLGHQHVLFHPHGIPRDHPDFSELERSRKLNWKGQAAIIQYAIRTGQCMNRWKNIVTTMIEKEPGNPKLHRLRVIHLYESDYNLILGNSMRALMHSCEERKAIHDGMYGSRANCQAMDPVFIELLQYDYASLTRWSEIKFSNDATSCYDRHVVAVCNLISQSMGLHPNIAQLQGTMLHEASYSIKTQLGVSDQKYAHSILTPIHGTGQGSKASSYYWSLLCNYLFQLYDESCHGARYTNITNTLQTRLGMDGFVDDNACNVNAQGPNDSDLLAHAQKDAQLWHDITWGGSQALELSKCFCRILQTKFSSSGAPYFSDTQEQTITIHDSQGTAIPLKTISAYVPYKTLGTMQSPSAHTQAQFQALLKKSNNLKRTFAMSACSGYAAWLFYNNIFMKSIGYPMAACRLNYTQLLQLQNPMVSILLNRLHYAKTLSRALAYGPRLYGGIGIPSLELLHGSSKVMLLLRHLRIQRQPSTLFRIILDRAQYCAGVGYPILQYPQQVLPHLEGLWIVHLHEFLRSINGSLKIADASCIPLARQLDQYLMQLAMDSKRFTPQEICRINYCRYYLQVLTLSDISNAQGTFLAAGIKQGYRSIFSSQSTLAEPKQQRPDERSWGAWRKFLRLFSDKSGRLFKPLGPWTSLPNHRRYLALLSPSRSRLYIRKRTDYTVHVPVRERIFSHNSNEYTTDFPSDSIPVDIIDTPDGWKVMQPPSKPHRTPDAPRTQPLTFEEYCMNLPDHESLILQRIEVLLPDIHDVFSAVADSESILVVSDGGARDNFGSFGWVLCTNRGKRLVKSSGPVFGNEPRSYRAECQGAKASILFLFRMCDYCEHQPPATKLEFYCDNLGLVKKLHKLQTDQAATAATCLHAEWDLLIAIHNLLSKWPVKPTIQHVQGHQDRNQPKHSLPLAAQLNMEADELASYELEEFSSHKPQIPFDPTCQALLIINDVAITRDYSGSFQRQVHGQALLQYYSQRFKWPPHVIDQIAWTEFSTAYKIFPITKTFYHKFGWKQLPIGQRLHVRQQHIDHRCPLCFAEQEDDDHIFQCPHTASSGWTHDLFSALSDLVEPFLDPDLLMLCKQGLSSYFSESSFALPHQESSEYYSADFNNLAKQQSQIGWDHFFRGKWAQSWGPHQQQYALKHGFQRESTGWQMKCIRLFAKFAYRIWCSRNQSRHGRDQKSKHQIQRTRVQREMEYYYSLRPSMCLEDQHIFQLSLADQLQLPTKQLTEWIKFNKSFISLSRRRARKITRIQNQRIPHFFPVQKQPAASRPRPAPNREHTQAPHQCTNTITDYFHGPKQQTSKHPYASRHRQNTQRSKTDSSLSPVNTLRLRQLYLGHYFPDHPG